MKYIHIVIIFFAISYQTVAQVVNVDVNLNFNHIVDTCTSFDRSKFVTIHADAIEPEWDAGFGANELDDLRNDFLYGYDVFMGRNTGPITGELRSTKEDINRPGFADTTDIATRGQNFKNWYAAKASIHQYEKRNNLIVCAQLHPFWPDGTKTATAWSLSQADSETEPFGTASGEYMAHFMNNYFGKGGESGQPKPNLVEIINEPLYHIHDYEKVFKYHNSVAQQIKKVNPELQVGGYCTAFPNLEENNFSRWEQRWKKFMDMSGENMDFWSIHLYDFPTFGGTQQYRKGSNMEATFDMMEQYSQMKFGMVKDFMISEYGASPHDYQGAWSSYRDWLHIKSSNSMMLQFMERPDRINQTINFLIIKATWGTTNSKNTYPHRLFRKEQEPNLYRGQWVYTDMIKLYQLWSDVKGKRVESKSYDSDILTDSYVQGDTVFVIINNLSFEKKTISLNLNNLNENKITGLKTKHLYLGNSNSIKDQNKVVLQQEIFNQNIPTEFELNPEGTMILAYHFSQQIETNQTFTEQKYYADKYYQAIHSESESGFKLDGIKKGEQGESTLRLGLGREHGKCLRPEVYFNDVQLFVPHNFRGDEQAERKSFFGILEINVPYEILKESNHVKVKFPDNGGFISTVTLQAFELSEALSRLSSNTITSFKISPENATLKKGNTLQLKEEIHPTTSSNILLEWESLNPEIATVSTTGFVTALKNGTARIVAQTTNSLYADTVEIVVAEVFGNITVDNHAKYLNTQYSTKDKLTIKVNYEAGSGNVVSDKNGGVKVFLRECTSSWSVVKDYIEYDNTAIGKQTEQANIEFDLSDLKPSAELPAGNFYFLLPVFSTSDGKDYAYQGLNPIQIVDANKIPASISVDNHQKYLTTQYESGKELEVKVNFHAGSGYTVTDQLEGVTVMLRECTSSWAVVNDVVASDESVIGKESGQATVKIDLKGIKPTSELAAGNFYFLLPRFQSSNGSEYAYQGLFPITITANPNAINELVEQKLFIYPNPANSHINVEGYSSYENIEYFNHLGKLIERQNLKNKKVQINHLEDGMYILRFSNDKQSEFRKLIIKR